MSKERKASAKKMTAEEFAKEFLPALYKREQQKKEESRSDYGKILAQRAMNSIQL